jgi:hypothetical protein
MSLLFITISAKISIQQLSLGRFPFENLAGNDVTAHVEIPVGPFALIRAINPEKPSPDPHRHSTNAEAIEKNIYSVSVSLSKSLVSQKEILLKLKLN